MGPATLLGAAFLLKVRSMSTQDVLEDVLAMGDGNDENWMTVFVVTSWFVQQITRQKKFARPMHWVPLV
jgi:hypothetical protein